LTDFSWFQDLTAFGAIKVPPVATLMAVIKSTLFAGVQIPIARGDAFMSRIMHACRPCLLLAFDENPAKPADMMFELKTLYDLFIYF
jgi:hypothetical protein